MDKESYISESRDWYYHKHLYSGIQTVSLFIISIFIILSFITLMTILNANTGKTTIRFPLYVENNADENHYIKSLFDPKKSIDQVFAEHMIQRYIFLRETYTTKILEKSEWESLLLNISHMSSHKVFEEFLNKILPSRNSNSRIIRYRFNTRILPQITQIQMIQFSNTKPIEAAIYFSISKCVEGYDHCISSDYVSVMRFDISYNPEFTFRVEEYTKYIASKYNPSE